ncbi:MAG: hypothetical protein ABWX74_02840 [Aeromicrobium sp.]
MRRTILWLAACVLAVTGCGGGTDTIGADDLTKQQDAADDVARTVVSAIVKDLGGAPPSVDTLGRGLYAGCDGGDADQASYFIDTYVTYDVRPTAEATKAVSQAVRGAGLMEKGLEMTGGIMFAEGDVTVDVSSQEKGGGSAGQNIFVSTGCLAIGKDAIAAFNAKNGRPVAP